MAQISPQILAQMKEGQVDDQPQPNGALCALEGTVRQIQWATNLRTEALTLKWPDEIRVKLARIKDATWWIANKMIQRTMKFKEPSPNQMAPGAPPLGQAEQSEPEALTTPPASAASADKTDQRIADALGWAESVSKVPKLAEAAIIAVLANLYKEPMKSRLRTVGWMKLGEAQCGFAKDEDAIKRMLSKA